MSSQPSIISALPQFNQPQGNDALAASSPSYQALLSQTGGDTSNLNSLAASNPAMASVLSLMNPQGGLNPQQAAQFGPLFSLLFSLQQPPQQ